VMHSWRASECSRLQWSYFIFIFIFYFYFYGARGEGVRRKIIFYYLQKNQRTPSPRTP